MANQEQSLPGRWHRNGESVRLIFDNLTTGQQAATSATMRDTPASITDYSPITGRFALQWPNDPTYYWVNASQMEDNMLDQDTVPVKVEDLRPGMRVDLESCPYLNKEPSAIWEFAIVDTVERETENCILVQYQEQAAGYPVGTLLKVRRDPEFFCDHGDCDRLTKEDGAKFCLVHDLDETFIMLYAEQHLRVEPLMGRFLVTALDGSRQRSFTLEEFVAAFGVTPTQAYDEWKIGDDDNRDNFDPGQFSKLIADSPAQIRQQDVFRLFDECAEADRLALYDWLVTVRPDLRLEADTVAAELDFNPAVPW